MSGGYTPLYDTMLSGTLFGRWPHTGIWACLLSRVSREGVIDETPASLAAAIGVPVELLMECITDFMQPDPNSRTATSDGRRLTLIDPNRSWGWKVVNHGKYREKARKKDFDAQRTETGADAARKAKERAESTPSRDVPTCPAMSRDVPLSESEAETVKSKRRKTTNGTRIPEDFKPDLAYATNLLPDIDAEMEAQAFTDYWRSRVKDATKADWSATWRTWVRRCKSNANYARTARAREASGQPPRLHDGVKWQ